MFVQGRASRKPVDVGDAGRRPGRDDHRLPRQQRLLSDDDAELTVEAAAPTHERDPALLEPGQLPSVVQVRDHVVPPRQHRVDVYRRHLEPGHASDFVRQLDGTQKRLRRHARPVRALSADEPVLDDRDREAVLAEPAGGHFARDTRAQHNNVELAHIASRRSSSVSSHQSRRGPRRYAARGDPPAP